MSNACYHNKYLYSNIEKGSLLDKCGVRDLLIKYKHNNDLCCFILTFSVTAYVLKLFDDSNFVNSLIEFFRGNYGRFE